MRNCVSDKPEMLIVECQTTADAHLNPLVHSQLPQFHHNSRFAA